jgi:hypothetical protein
MGRPATSVMNVYRYSDGPMTPFFDDDGRHNSDMFTQMAGRVSKQRRTQPNHSNPPMLRPSRGEVTDILNMHEFSRDGLDEVNPDSVDLGETVHCQLMDYVATIAPMYHDNPFYNFEHASRVACRLPRWSCKS